MITDELAGIGVLPVAVIDNPRHAAPLAHALAEGGAACAEITLGTPAGIAAIASIAELDGFVVGAGTVLTAGQIDGATAAGARFVISPGFAGRLSGHAAR